MQVERAPKVLKELGQLVNADQDLDFFENMKHLQIHRKAKALIRLTKGIQSGELVFSGETLHQVLLLFPAIFLFNPAYEKVTHVIDAAIQVS
jgi:U3 small nucleolar RNA-associated protein 20